MAPQVPQSATESKGYNNYFVNLEDLNYVPPYLKDVAETPEAVKCSVEGQWPTWLQGTFMR